MPKRILEGNVVSDKQDKTVTVLVERRFMHPMYKKYVRQTDKYAAHDELNVFRVGDRVQIEECRPISKRKTWTVITPALREPEVKVAAPKVEKAEKAPKAPKAEKPAAKEKASAKAKPAAKKTETKKK